jgi:hypothetical protein
VDSSAYVVPQLGITEVNVFRPNAATLIHDPMNSDLVGTVELRNSHWVYRKGTDFRVVQKDRHGEEHAELIPRDVVDFIAGRTRGGEIDVDKAAQLLDSAAGDLRLPYTYGYKLHYYAQDVLIVLVAVGAASVRKVGRAYLYAIRPS